MTTNQNLRTVDANELIATLECDRQFYDKMQELTQQALPCFFTPVHERDGFEIHFDWQLNGLSFSRKKITSARINDIVRATTRRLSDAGLFSDNASIPHSSTEGAVTYFMAVLREQCQTGEAQLDQETEHALAVIYANPEKRTNVAAACRALNKTRHAVNGLIERYSLDMYTRYRAVQNGTPYAIAMGDCKPYIHNLPAFTPIVTVTEDSPDHIKALVKPGALVAKKGSSRWYDVKNERSSLHHIIWTTDGYLSLPCRVLPAQYRSVASRFCSVINDFDATKPTQRHDYFQQLKAA